MTASPPTFSSPADAKFCKDINESGPVTLRSFVRSAVHLTSRLKTALRDSIHPASRARLQRIVSSRQAFLGCLTVIVPAYNVESYLADCLSSIVTQSYPYLEIIVIDDGSSDASHSIADNFALRDPRVRVITIRHAGNGRARNVGIERSTGDFITFADSDDVVAPNAYSTMLTKIRETGSDFIVGSSNRLIGQKKAPVSLSESLHVVERLRITIDDYPEIIHDVFLWNKVFRRDFWIRAIKSIPENVLYEDQETTARAYVRADFFDVIPEVVYSWRVRPDGSSITQSKGSLRNLNDRLHVAGRVTDLLAAEAGESVLVAWFQRLLGSDLVPYFEQVPYGDRTYWAQLSTGIARIHARLTAQGSTAEPVFRGIGPHERILGQLAAAGSREDLELVLIDRAENGTGFLLIFDEGRFLAKPNYLGALSTQLPVTQLECPAAALVPVSQITAGGWSDTGELLLKGYIYISGLDSASPAGNLRVYLQSERQNKRELAVTRTVNPYIDVIANDPFASHAASSFAFHVAPEDLAANFRDGLDIVLELAVGATVFIRRHNVVVPRQSPPVGQNARAGRKPTVTGFAANPNGETFTVTFSQPPGRQESSEGIRIALATRRGIHRPIAIAGATSTETVATFSMSHTRWGEQVFAPLSDAYTLRYATDGQDVGRFSPTMAVAAQLDLQLPLDHELTHGVITAWCTNFGALAVTVAPPLSLTERGKFNQRRLRMSYAESEPSALFSDVVLFESFAGKSCTDNPRALSDALSRSRPDLEIVWSISDHSVAFPSYAKPVIHGTEEWYNVLRRAATLVNNNNFPSFFNKTEGQTYVQTWHGTPLKKVGLDAPTAYLSASYRELMRREASAWDILLTQDDYARRLLPGAFGFSGDVLNLGYPRNDSLLAPDRKVRGSRVRRLLGIAPHKKVLLYAPTWRDDVRDKYRRNSLVNHMDFRLARQRLGEDFVFLLRGHHNVAFSAPNADSEVIDVTMYPEINDLILASDVLVTDYSSIVFDYCLTDRPMYFLVPDLAQYRDNTRGLYLDWEAIAPGPLCLSTNQLCDEILETDYNSVAPFITDFKSQYASRDDGSAAARVVSTLWSK